MTSLQRNQSFSILVVALCLNGLAVGCSEKSNAPAATAKNDTKTATDTATAEAEAEGEGEAGEGEAGEGEGGEAAFDLCKGLSAKKAEIDGFSAYIDELCGTGEGQNKLPTLRKSENVFKGGDPKLLKKTDKGDGSTVAVRLFTSTIVAAKAVDYFALLRLQVSKPKIFGENYEHDSLIQLSNVDASAKSSSFTYDYSDGDGSVLYDATARFYTLKTSTAFVSATTMDKSKPRVTMEDFKGLIIVNQKDATHTEVFTMSDQKYEVAPGQEPALYDTRATEKAGKEQVRMYNNADKANEAPGLIK